MLKNSCTVTVTPGLHAHLRRPHSGARATLVQHGVMWEPGEAGRLPASARGAATLDERGKLGVGDRCDHIGPPGLLAVLATRDRGTPRRFGFLGRIDNWEGPALRWRGRHIAE